MMTDTNILMPTDFGETHMISEKMTVTSSLNRKAVLSSSLETKAITNR